MVQKSLSDEEKIAIQPGYKVLLYNTRTSVTLGEELGGGGEGSVYC